MGPQASAFGPLVPPKPLEPIRRQRRISRRILDIAVSQVALQSAHCLSDALIVVLRRIIGDVT